MPTYVKGPDSDTWHWCTNCSNYPTTIAKSETHSGKQRPASGELDNECLSKENNGNCSS
jgi:hypothetical protein